MEHTAPVLAISVILLGAGIVVAYNFYNVRYQSPAYFAPTGATFNLFATTSQKLPSNVTSLLIFFSEIDIHSVGTNSSWVKLFTSPTSVDMAKIVNVSQAVGTFAIPSGSYDSLRIAISQSSEVVAGSNIPLTVPASAQGGLAIPFPTQFNFPKDSTGGATMNIAIDLAGLASKNMNPTVSVILTIGMGVSLGTSGFSTSSSTTTATTSGNITKSCALGIPSWPFC